MFINEELDRLLRELKLRQAEVGSRHPGDLIVSRVVKAVGDFEGQPTIWDAYQGRNDRQGWDLPEDFQQHFTEWVDAYRALVAARIDDRAALELAVDAIRHRQDLLLEPLYRKKEESRLRVALDLFGTAEEMMRQNLRRRFPHASEADIERRLDEWLQTRPGAEQGDWSPR